MADVISLGVGEPDFVTPWHIREAAIYALERGGPATPRTSGCSSCARRSATHRSKNTFGSSYDPQTQILIAVGVSEAMDIALRAVINPGDEIIYHEPCYVSYSPSVALAHGVPVPFLPRRGWVRGPRRGDREGHHARSKVLVLNFPTNPTGGTMTRVDLRNRRVVLGTTCW
jgi:aminotransferase